MSGFAASIFCFVPMLLVPTVLTAAESPLYEADVCVYGGTSGGVVAAVQAARMGKRVVLVEPGRHLGGMTSGGLTRDTWVDEEAVQLFVRPNRRANRTALQRAYHWCLAWLVEKRRLRELSGMEFELESSPQRE